MKLISVLLVLSAPFTVSLIPSKNITQAQVPNGYDLIAAVNALRANHGLPPYHVDPLLMLSAQMQADYLASQAPGPVSGHVGPGGTDADARALAIGFPYVQGLDINENWAAMPVGMSFTEIFNTVWSDAAHQHTMLHQRGQLAGAGVAIAGDTIYLILDVAAYWGDAGKTPWPTSSAYGATGSTPGISQYIAPVKVATPQADVSIVHQVQSGQSLWSIAIKYGVKIDAIHALNHIAPDEMIYIGQKLVVQAAGQKTVTPILQTAAPSLSDFLPPQAQVQLTSIPFVAREIPPQSARIDPSGIFFLLFVLAGAGLVLVFIGMRR
jgi:LysM repeat protein